MGKGEDYKIANDLPAAIERGFSDILKLEGDIAALMAQHIKPLVALRTKAWRRLKAESDIGRHVLSKWYGLYKLENEANDFEDPHEAERLQAELKRAYEALRDGEVLDFIALLEAAENGRADKTKQDKPTSAEKSASSADAPAASSEPKAKATVIKKEDDWDAPPDHKDAEQQEQAGQAGYAYDAGYKAGLAGSDVKDELKRLGWHHASIKAKNFRAGHETGDKKRQADLYLAAQSKISTATAITPAPVEEEEVIPGDPSCAAEDSVAAEDAHRAEEAAEDHTAEEETAAEAEQEAGIPEAETVNTGAQVVSFRLGERRGG